MSFGVVQTMISTLKNNEKMRSKRVKIKRPKDGCKITYGKTEYNLPKASPEQFVEIRKRLQKEHKILMVKVIVLTILILIILVGVLMASS